MKDIRQIVAHNLVTLRKQNKLTQIELAAKINYSDKAISRWENGEVLPDLQILQSLSEVYNVPLSYMIEQHSENEKPKTKNNNWLLGMFFAIMVVWFIATIIFVYVKIFDDWAFWQIFVFAFSVSSLVARLYCGKWCQNKLYNMLASSSFMWSLITSIYLYFLELNLWLIFLVGVPSQICLIISMFIKNKKDKI